MATGPLPAHPRCEGFQPALAVLCSVLPPTLAHAVLFTWMLCSPRNSACRPGTPKPEVSSSPFIKLLLTMARPWPDPWRTGSIWGSIRSALVTAKGFTQDHRDSPGDYLRRRHRGPALPARKDGRCWALIGDQAQNLDMRTWSSLLGWLRPGGACITFTCLPGPLLPSHRHWPPLNILRPNSVSVSREPSLH